MKNIIYCFFLIVFCSCMNKNVKLVSKKMVCLDDMESKKVLNDPPPNYFDLYSIKREDNHLIPRVSSGDTLDIDVFFYYLCDSKFKIDYETSEDSIFLIFDELELASNVYSPCVCVIKNELQFSGRIEGKQLYIKRINKFSRGSFYW